MVQTESPVYVLKANEAPGVDRFSSFDAESQRRAFKPRGGAKAFIANKDPEVVFYGPSGTGKSFASLHKLWMVADKYPGCRLAIVRKYRSTITQSAMVTFEQKVCLPGDGVKFNTVDQQYNFRNGSAIVVAGLDDPTKILSTEFDIIYVQECTEIDEPTWEMLKTRLRWGIVPYQQLIGDCNPDSERHWIKQREKLSKLVLLSSQHTDNPAFWDEDKQDWTPAGKAYIDNLKAMSGHMRERFFEGKWVGAEGMIYTEYSYRRNVIDKFTLPKEWNRYLAIDFGFTNPFVCQWWAEDHDGRLYLYREVYGTQTTVEDWAHIIHDLSGKEDYKAIICDHDAEDRATLERHVLHSVDQCYAGRKKEFHKVPKGRIGTVAADKKRESVITGIQEVQNRFRRAGDGRPRLFIMKDALACPPDERMLTQKRPTCTEDEIDSYIWDEITTGRMGVRTMEAPRKVNDHGVDALRYMVHYLDGKSAQLPVSIFGQKTPHSFRSAPANTGPANKDEFWKKYNPR